MGNATFGSNRPDLAPGDYLAHITDVRCDETEDFKDKTKKRPVFIWSVDLQMPDGRWESRSLFTPRSFTDMSKVTDPKFVSNLNRLVRACGRAVPQTLEDVEAWDEQGLVNCRFVWRVEEDPETGAKVRKLLALAQPTNGHGNGAAHASAPQAQAAPQAQQPAQPAMAGIGAAAAAGNPPAYDPFDNQ